MNTSIRTAGLETCGWTEHAVASTRNTYPMQTSFFVNTRYRDAPGSPIRELNRFTHLPDMLSLAGGYPDPALMDAQALQRLLVGLPASDFAAALKYGGTEGEELLRLELAKLSATRGLRTMATDILTLSGSQQGIDLLARTVLNEGDTVLVEAPTYPAALSAFRIAGARIHQLPSDQQGLVLDGLEDALIQHRPKLIYIVPTFGNPTGRTLPLERRHALLALAVKYNCLVVEDDPYGELWFDVAPPPAIYSLRDRIRGAEHCCIYLGSLSKIVAPGLRLGWMLGPADVRRACVLAKQTDDMHASTLTQVAAAHYLRQELLALQLPRLRAVYGARAKSLACVLREHLGDSIAFDEPAGGLFLWARVRGVDTSHWLHNAIRHQVMFVPGNAFFAHPTDPCTLRLSFAGLHEEQLLQAGKRLARSLSSAEPV
jgi:2-aminoadipate transaminase